MGSGLHLPHPGSGLHLPHRPLSGLVESPAEVVIHSGPHALVDGETLPSRIPKDQTRTLRKLERLAVHGPPVIHETGAGLGQTAHPIDQRAVPWREVIGEKHLWSGFRESNAATQVLPSRIFQRGSPPSASV